jgi:putative endonuclease
MQNPSLGKIGETVAANYLIAQGYTLLESNYMNQKGYRVGEIDIIAEDKQKSIVFVEVKSRKGKKDRIAPEASVTNAKIRKIQKAAQYFLRKRNFIERDWRIDAITIIFDFDTRRLNLRHIRAIRM